MRLDLVAACGQQLDELEVGSVGEVAWESIESAEEGRGGENVFGEIAEDFIRVEGVGDVVVGYVDLGKGGAEVGEKGGWEGWGDKDEEVVFGWAWGTRTR